MPEAHITPETIPTKQLDGVHINDKVMVTGADNVTKVVYGIAIIDVIASCTSAADTEIKTVQISNYTESEIPPGTKLHITFTYANTYGDASTTNPKLQLKNSNNEDIGSPLNICDSRGHIAGANCWKAGDEMDFLVVGNKAKIQNSDIRWQDSSSSVLSDGSVVYNKQSVDSALANLEAYNLNSDITDYNDAFVAGKTTRYSLGINLANAPDDNGVYMLESVSSPSSLSANYYGYQIATRVGYNVVQATFIRVKNGANSWTAWKRISTIYKEQNFEGIPGQAYTMDISNLELNKTYSVSLVSAYSDVSYYIGTLFFGSTRQTLVELKSKYFTISLNKKELTMTMTYTSSNPFYIRVAEY